ncbi:hypothetical protein N0V84_005961 [Fusarium piperis]|uniref:Hydantoinase A/oxoprolinase domain-containing protein n=1 Tax=Fusarium piperis TaxID=1435070 RepID=A0A9W8WCW9_9HYPO|nr:hypothetical protein N0V84_005961 [Fusarium piperis]
MSHEVSQPGFLARENAAILNATLRPLAEQTIRGFQAAIRDIFKNEPCVLYLTQHDDSVLKTAEAIELPIRTFNSGPTNSIRGGEFLWRAAMESEGNGKASREDALVVVDIGGATSDSGLLLPNGLPMMSSVTSFVGGVRTNFALLAVESIGLGGGSISQGAKKETVDVAEFTVLPIQNADAKARIIARAIGELDVVVATLAEHETIAGLKEDLDTVTHATNTVTKRSAKEVAIEEPVDVQTYRPTIKGREWIISVTDLEFIAAGCKVLGCGGGGDPYQEYVKAKSILASAPGSIRVVSPSDLPEDSLVGWTACIGSPEVSMERLENNECLQAHGELIRATGSPEVSSFLAAEIGGGNGVVNLGVSTQKGVPCLDADLMGRVYPTMWQLTFNVYGSSKGETLVPTSIASGDGTVVTMTETRSDQMVDKTLRAACVVMGCRAGNAGPPKKAKLVQEQAVSKNKPCPRTSRKSIEDKMGSIIDAVGRVLAEGKTTSVESVLKTGHTYGVLEVKGALSNGTKVVVKVPFKNENAYVEAISADGSSSILAAVPDLIAVIDSETGVGLGTRGYKYGLRVIILAMLASPRWTSSKRGMELGGHGIRRDQV